MLAAELNLSAAFTALAIGGVLLAVVWVLDRRALRRELEVDEEYEAVELLHDELLHDELRHDEVGLLTPHIDDTPSNVRVIGRVDRAEPAPAPREPVIAAPVATAEHAVIVASVPPVEATPVIEPEPVIELVDEPVVEPEPVREPAPEPARARSKMPKGADAVLAALADVIPEMGGATVAVQAPAEPEARPTPRDTVESLAEFFETPAEPSGAELMARQRARHSTPTNR